MKKWWACLLGFSVAHACTYDYTIWMLRSRDADPYFRFVQKDKAGYIDRSGNVVIPAVLNASGNFGDEFRGGWRKVRDGIVDAGGRRREFRGVEMFYDFSEGLAVAQPEGPAGYHEKYGYIDTAGKMVVEPRFDWASEFSEGMARVTIGGKTGYIDRTGKLVIAAQFSDGTDFHEGRAAAILENCKRAGALCGGDHYAPEGNPEGRCQYAVIDRTGRPVSDARYDKVLEFSEGLAPVMSGGAMGYIDTTGRLAISAQFESAFPFSDGLALVKRGERWGYISHSGEFAIPARFAEAMDFSEGLAAVRVDPDSWSYIRKDGTPAFAGRFALASEFRHGLAHVMIERKKERREAKFAYVDSRGRTVFEYRGEN
ncbi:MAG: Leptospira repeat protein [Candidatus Solibacter sp.]|nr:Leptospira repeat protein [Candidatus Solibacter sp.]